MSTSVSEDRLLRAILGLLDGVSVSAVDRLRTRRISTHSTLFAATDVYALLEAVEDVRPGLLDHYASLRREGSRQ